MGKPPVLSVVDVCLDFTIFWEINRRRRARGEFLSLAEKSGV
jgi:hypothetical protein